LDQRAPFRRRQIPRHHAHRGGFARAVRPEKAQNLALVDLEADLVDRGEIAEPLCQPLYLERTTHRLFLLPGRRVAAQRFVGAGPTAFHRTPDQPRENSSASETE